MEESSSSRRGPARRKDRHTPKDEAGDPIKCTGKNCRSCTAGVIADCIAVCCCPCAVLSFFVLAFFKAPYMMGRRCLGLGKKKGKSIKCEAEVDGRVDVNFENRRVDMESVEIGDGFEDEDEDHDQEEQDRVWLELYQLGHLGFGRVSFSGIQSQGKAN